MAPLCRLCRHGEWTLYWLDDYFPCSPGGGPVYARAHGNELWAMLLQKAFAKSVGAYDRLVGGFAHEALIDITGCPTVKLDFKDPSVKRQLESGELFDVLSQSDKERCCHILVVVGQQATADNPVGQWGRGGRATFVCCTSLWPLQPMRPP